MISRKITISPLPGLITLCLLLPLFSLVTANPFGEPHRCFNMTRACDEDICGCTCDRMDISTGFEVYCPPEVGQSRVRLMFVPSKYFWIDCRSSNEEFQHMPLMDVGDVERVVIKGCKIPPSTPLIDIMQRFGIRSFQSLFLTHDDKDFPFRRAHFKGLDIRRLSLNTPGLEELPDDFFAEIVNITWLEIKNTKLQRVKNALTSLTQLKTFDMPQNAMTQLEEGAFESLKGMERLSLYSNQFKVLGKEDFRGLGRVTSLDLLGNQIETIDADAFLPLVNLTFIGLNKNRFRTLPEGLFRANAQLDEAKFFYNNISTLPSDLFANLPNLKQISFGSSGVETIPETVFANSSGITNLTLSDNRIQVLGGKTFLALSSLLRLELQMNRIVTLPRELLSTCRQLVHLDLSNNLIEALPGGFFQSQVNLAQLYLKNNRLTAITPRTFDYTVNIRVLDLSENRINFPGLSHFTDDVQQSPLAKLKSLEYLRLRNNSIEHVHSDFTLLMTQLKELDLSYNNISYVQYQHLQFHGNGILVNISHNRITDIDFSSFEVIASAQSSPPRRAPEVDLENNPLRCDCKVLHFARFVQKRLHMEAQDYLRVRAESLTCAQPERLSGVQLRSVDPMHLICDFTKSFYNQSCPAACSCALRLADQAVIVNCSRAGLREVPPLPLATKLNYSFTILHIGHNLLERLPSTDMVVGYSEVREVYAQWNNISVIVPENIPDDLTCIDLTGNDIKAIPATTMTKMNSTKMRLAENSWACDCQMRDVLSFMQLNYQRIDDYKTLKCTSGLEISTLTTNDICPQELQIIIIIATILSCLGIILGLVAALYYKYQQEIKIWMYWHNILPFLFNSDVLDNDKKYDAFISYSHKDEDFVTDQLMPELEQKRRFNLCIHRRDWTPGDFIPEQIVRSVSESRRTLIVLSPNYVESVWGTMEFRTAHRSAMEDQVNRVIVIVFGKVDREALDPELKSYIDMNTYIEWGDPWFWERLHYALRTIQTKKEPTKSDGGLKKTPLKSSVDDKLELIHPSPINSPLTTPPAEHPLNYKQNTMNGHVNGAFIINTNSKQSDV